MAETIITHFRTPIGRAHPISEVELIPSGGGVFDVKLDGELIFSKHLVGRHAEPREILKAIGGKLAV